MQRMNDVWFKWNRKMNKFEYLFWQLNVWNWLFSFYSCLNPPGIDQAAESPFFRHNRYCRYCIMSRKWWSAPYWLKRYGTVPLSFPRICSLVLGLTRTVRHLSPPRKCTITPVHGFFWGIFYPFDLAILEPGSALFSCHHNNNPLLIPLPISWLVNPV